MRTLQFFISIGVICASSGAVIAGCGSSDNGGGPSAAGAPNTSAGAPGAGGAGAGAPGAGAPGAGAPGAGAPGAGAGGAGTAGASTGGAGAPAVSPGNAANGATLYAAPSIACNTCHGDDGAGGLGPNITPSATAGIGGWTEAQFYQLVRNGIARSGQHICMSMPLFNAATITDQGIADVFAYVQSKPANNTVQKGSFAALDPACATQ